MLRGEDKDPGLTALAKRLEAAHACGQVTTHAEAGEVCRLKYSSDVLDVREPLGVDEHMLDSPLTAKVQA